MEIARVSRLTDEDVAGRDFSFEISQVVAKPYEHLALDQPIKTTPVTASKKSYGFDGDEFAEGAKDAEKVIFTLADGENVYGYAFAFKDWNNMVALHTIALDAGVRGKGNGARLLDAVVGWARGLGVAGVRIESQSNNVAACRFYKKCGLRFGGYDEFLYRGIEEHKSETALFWYRML